MLRVFIVGDQILEPFFQPAHAAAGAAFGPADPAAQLRHLETRDKRGETGIGGIEQMMAFVEDIAHAPLGRRVGRLVHASQSLRRLRDHQRMVGDDDRRMTRAADGALDETVR